MKRLRTGIIGCGKVAHLHAAALRDLPQSDFRAVCSRDAQKGSRFAAGYGVHAFTNLEKMIIEEGLEVLSVCTPHPFHVGPTVKATEHGVHVIVEKPLASSLSDCDKMIEAAHSAAVTLGTISQRRFYTPAKRIKRAIEEGRIGKPVLASVTMYGWRDDDYYKSDPWRGTWTDEGGGVLVNQAPHQLDLMLDYMGEADELFGYWDNFNHPTIKVDDTAVAVIRFKNGGLGQVLVSNAQNPALYSRIIINGSNGSTIGVQTDGGAMFIAGMTEITEPPINHVWTIPGEEDLLRKWQEEDTRFFQHIEPMEYYHREQLEDFLKSILNRHNPLVSGEDGRRTVELFSAIYQSEKIRQPIRFPLR